MTQPQKKFKPKENYAISDGRFVTLYAGKRTVQYYTSGQKLKGRVVKREDYML